MNLLFKRTLLVVGVSTACCLSYSPRIYAASPISMEIGQQVKKVTGMVVDGSGEPIIGANIHVKGTTNGAISDFDGKFTLSVEDGQTIDVSYIGYVAQSFVYKGQNDLRIVMKEDTETLDEVVVVGYGVVRKSDLTGSVGKMDMKEMNKTSSIDAAQAMQGRMAGVNVISNSGSPGAGVTIRVRGVGTINNSDPLFVVDGFPCDDISHIAPTDIESMEVLKDASATAIYGSRGANGVILVKTKSGSTTDKTEVTANAYWGVSQIAKSLKLADATQFANARKTIGSLDPTLQYILDSQSAGNYIKGTDWQDEIMRTALSQRYNVGVQGAGDKYNYNHGITYSHEKGIMKGSELKKLMFHTNNTYTIVKNVKLGLNINYVWYEKPGLSGEDYYTGVLPSALRSDPVSAAWDSYTDFFGQMYYSTSNTNPAMGIWQNSYAKTQEHRFLGNFYLQVDDLVVKGLSFRAQFGQTYIFNDARIFSPSYFITASQKNDEQTLKQTRNNGSMWVNTNYFSYNGSISKLNINATLGMELQSNTWSDVWAVGYNVPEDADLRYLSAAKDGEKFQLGGSKSQNRLASYFFRSNLSWNNRYLFTATVRYDGTSRFTGNQRWGWFPSFSGGWNVANENFMEGIRDVLPILKVRAGWGKVGNQGSAGDFDYVSSVIGGYTYVFNNKIVEGSVQEQLANKELTWESSEQYNVGADYGFFDNKLNGSVDFFIRKTKDMIISKPIPMYAGKRRARVNAGTMENKGVELALTWRDNIGKVGYAISGNATWIKNRVTSLAGGDPIQSGTVDKVKNITMTEEGREIAYFYGYKTGGIFKTQADLDGYVTENGTPINGPGGSRPELGDVMFLDLNGDGKITDADRTYLGSACPKWTGGLNLSLDYKNIDFTVFMNFSVGNKIVNAMYQSLYSTSMMETNISEDMALNHWSPDNPTSDLPRLALIDSNENATTFSDRMVENGSYFRIKQIQLGYTLPKSWTSKAYIKSARIYGSIDNLYTFTKYSGLDPEIFGAFSDPLYAGVDMVNYPQPRTFSVGLNVTF